MMEYNETVMKIISNEKRALDAIANEFVKGNETDANQHIRGLFMTYGYTKDCEDTNQLLDYVGGLIGLAQKAYIWKPIGKYPKYEITVEGDVRRIGSTTILKEENGRVKIRDNGRTITLKVMDAVYDTYYKNNTDNDEKMEEVNMTSDIDVPMMTGALDWSGITETNLVEDEKKRID